MTLAVLPNINAFDAIDVIVAKGGDQNLAAEALGIPRSQLAGIIASDPLAGKELARRLQVLTVIDTYHTLDLVNVALRGTLSTLEGKDLVKLQGQLTEALSKLTTATSNPNGDTADGINSLVRSLPPELREAVVVFLQPTDAHDPREAPNEPPNVHPSPNDSGESPLNSMGLAAPGGVQNGATKEEFYDATYSSIHSTGNL